MKTETGIFRQCRRISVFLLGVIMIAGLLMPAAVNAKEPEKTVRVGWYESTFNTMDSTGRRSGYAYEYQLKVAAYTGWKYEYVNGSWSELLQMLIDGKIDMMSDISYTKERAQRMLYPELPMGTEEYYIFISPENKEISSDDYTTLNGASIGVNKGSIQTGLYLEWAKEHNISANLIELTTSEDESLQMLKDGKLDAYITMDAFKVQERLVPLCKIGGSDFYFAVSKNRPDLLDDLNYAMNRIEIENRNYNWQLSEKYLTKSGANTTLTQQEEQWLADHGTIKVGYQDNYMAFCASDKETGELTGALKDYLEYAQDSIANTHLDFETVPYATIADAMEGLKKGEVDCIFPVNLDCWDGEKNDITITPAILNTDLFAIVRQAEQNVFAGQEYVIVAVNEGNTNYDAILSEYFPSWRTVYYKDTQECLKAVKNRVADCVLLSNYRYNNIARLCEKYRLISYTTGVELNYCFAVRANEPESYSILTKAINLVPDSVVISAMSYYIAEDARLTVSDFLIDHLPIIMIIIGAVLFLILVLLIRSMRAEKKAARLIAATETDELTGLYNRNFFLEYANRMHQEQPDKPMDAIVLNIDHFHSVNALNGREFGDQALRRLARGIYAVVNETGGIGGRFEADRFDIYCPGPQHYQEIYDRLQNQLNELASDTSLSLRMGVMPWEKELEPVQMFDRARTACSMARGNYKNRVLIYDEKIRSREVMEQRLLNDLRRALDEYEFEVHYQPKYDIQFDPPKLVSAEALVRWRHPELGMIAPDDFVPMLERNGKITAVDQYVWAKAAKQIARWREAYGVLIPVSVNLSRVDVFDPSLETTLDRILSENGLTPEAFKLEVTESAYTGNEDQVIQLVQRLRSKGYEVEMDDFGTGYSSLNMLSAMPVDVLKMDRAFVRNIENNEKDIQLVALIIGAAKNLKIPVVAEGVETQNQLRLLKELGCDIVQGYYFSSPLHPSDFEAEILEKH